MTDKNENTLLHFVRAANQFPDKPALIHRNAVITYGELYSRVKRKANAFLKKGIQPGDRVLVFVPMSIELYENVLALFYIGATAVFLDEWVSVKRLALCCELAQCKGFIAGAKFRFIGRFLKPIYTIPVWLKASLTDSDECSDLFYTEGNHTALITFTTGSTGIPKAADRTHRFLNAQFNALLEEIQPNANDIGAPVLPIVLLMNLGVGATSLICNYNSKKPKKTDFKTLVDDLIRYKVNRMEASPDFVLRLGDYCVRNSIQLNHLERIYTGGAPVFPFQAKRLLNAFPSSQINIVYGSTEAEPISMINAVDLAQSKIQATDGLPVGQIYTGATVYIIPVSDKQVLIDSEEELVQLQCKTGALGEIIVSGDHVLTKYFRNEEAILMNKIFINDKCYHRTGDSGYRDEAGNLFLTGRCSGLIHYKDFLIKPFIYENALTEEGLCAIGTVIVKNNKLLLVVEGNESNRNKIIASMNEKGFPFDDCVFVKEIPRDKRHHSKIDYSLLIRELNRS